MNEGDQLYSVASTVIRNVGRVGRKEGGRIIINTFWFLADCSSHVAFTLLNFRQIQAVASTCRTDIALPSQQPLKGQSRRPAHLPFSAKVGAQRNWPWQIPSLDFPLLAHRHSLVPHLHSIGAAPSR
jgi:hypothetical protein